MKAIINEELVDIITHTNRHGVTWYVPIGGKVVNATYDSLYNGIAAEDLYDVDCFTSREPITNELELFNLINN